MVAKKKPARPSKPAHARSRGARTPKEPYTPTPCLVCGNPVSKRGASLCLNCVHKSERNRRPHFPGGARTEFGTRVARAVICVRCGKEDYLAFKPKDPSKVMCRACTEATVGLDEHGDKIQERLVEIVCEQCGRTVRILKPRPPKNPLEPPEPLLCRDCDLGIETRQGDKVLTGERRKSGIILKRRDRSEGQA